MVSVGWNMALTRALMRALIMGVDHRIAIMMGEWLYGRARSSDHCDCSEVMVWPVAWCTSSARVMRFRSFGKIR